jgi:hypothetical protein
VVEKEAETERKRAVIGTWIYLWNEWLCIVTLSRASSISCWQWGDIRQHYV